MIRFDPDKFRALLDEMAGKKETTVHRLVEDIDEGSAGSVRSSLCLSARDLLEPAWLGSAQRAHINECDFCTFFIRFWYTRYIVDEDVINLLSAVAAKIKEHPNDLYRELQVPPPDKDRVLCLSVDEMVNFGTLSAVRKEHLVACGQCSITVKLVCNMETPQL